ncbi:MAG: MFS transporter [Bacteroidaceae bacterium]|nr:MFS transporter [Bacteroidaceae bacterium]
MRKTSPWAWVPTLYTAEGLPYVVVMTVAVVLFKNLGLDNTDVALYTSWLYLPWVIKPFWSPLVDVLKTKRWWIVAMQLIVGAAMAGVAMTIPASGTVRWCLAFFWLMAFSSATHDIAADGYYMIELDEQEQSLFVGIRSTFYRVATIIGQGAIVALGGFLETLFKSPQRAWMYTFLAVSALFLLLCLYHAVVLPNPEKTNEGNGARIGLSSVFKNVIATFVSFFKKEGIAVALLFMLLYRLPEALLVKICPMFLLDPVDKGGLGLSTIDLGFAQGTVGVIGLTVGGILGGIVVARHGFKRWLWPMVLSITLPDAVYIFLAYYQPDNLWLTSACIGVEQFGYGFGFTAYMLYMLYFARGERQTAHYAFCTGFMALSMMLPGMVSGWLQEHLNYLNFFILAMALTFVTFAVTALVKVDPEFGKKKA